MIDHVSIQCADVAASAVFYDAVLAPLGGARLADFGEVIGFGVAPIPDFWLGPRTTGEGFRESHIAFTARDREAVRAFRAAAEGAGSRGPARAAPLAGVPPQLLRNVRARSGWQQCRSGVSCPRKGLGGSDLAAQSARSLARIRSNVRSRRA